MKIRYLRHNEIDKGLWDECVFNSRNFLPYALSWYLDAVCSGWEALVSDDYRYVMPLPVKKKFGFTYLINPRWTQQLGLFSADDISANVLFQFVKQIPYRFYDFNINYANLNVLRQSVFMDKESRCWAESIIQRKRANYVIDITGGMQVVRSRYDSNTRRCLTKALNCNLEVDEIDINKFVRFWQRENGDKAEELHRKLPNLAYAAADNNMGVFLGVHSEDTLIAAAFVIRTTKRLIFLSPVSNARGKECCAMFLLLDYLIKEYCCRYNLLFDCEGSMLEGVARFYRGFGSKCDCYSSVSKGRSARLSEFIHNSFSFIAR